MSRSRLAAPNRLWRGIATALIVALAALAVSGPGGSPASASDAPTVTGVAITSSAGDDNTYALGETITITVTFSEAVVVTGTPRLRIDMDPAVWGEKIVDYAGGSGAASLTFDHTVVEPNYSNLGIAVLANSLALNGGSIRSASSQADADLSHEGLSHDAAHRVNWQASPPALTPPPAPAPTVTDVAVTSDGGDDDTYALGETITITVTFSEAVVVTGTPRLRIDMDPAVWGEKIVDYAGGSGAASLTFDHIVVEPNYSTLGIAVLANSLALNGGSIRSASSQANADLSHEGLSHDAAHRVNWQVSPEPNRAPVVDTGTRNYERFVSEQDAPRGFLVSKSFAGLFSDPDGDQLTYSVSISGGRAQLAEEVSIGRWGRSDAIAEKGPYPREAAMRVFLKVDADDDWNALDPPLPARPVITVTLTASDPGGLSASVEGDFVIIWEPGACELAPPERVSALGVGRAAVAYWQAPSAESACEPVGYLVGARSVDSGEWTSEIAEPEARSHVLDGLTPGLIEYHVTTIYRRGESKPPLALPQLNVPEACNITLTVEANVDRGISGTWANVTGMPNGCVHGPEIEYEFKESTWDYFRNYGRFNNHGQSNPTQDSFIAYALKPGVTYDFRIVAVDAAGRKNPSNVASATVLYDVDGADEHSPRDVRVGVHNRGDAFVEWSDPALAAPGRTLSTFIVEWKTASGAAMTAEIDAAASNLHHITGLTHGSVYSVRVAARTTAAGDVQDAWSSPSPPFTAVSEPIQVWFITNTPFLNSASSLVFFRISRNTPSGLTVCRMVIAGVHKEINCPRKTVVHTEATGSMSVTAVDTHESQVVTRSSVHEGEFGGPRAVLAHASGGNGTLVIAWGEPSAQGHGGQGNLDAWIVSRRQQNGDGTWPNWGFGHDHTITDTTARSHTFTGLANGTWQVRVLARTDGDDGDPNTTDTPRLGFTSEIQTVTLAAGHTAVPGRVTGGTVTPGRAPVDDEDDAPGVGSLVVEWEPPSGGGSAVYAYQVRHRRGDYDYSTGGGAWTEGPEIYPRQTWRICGESSVDGCENPRSYAITGLIAGRKYDVAVRARNANGWGAWSWIGHFNIPNGFPPLLQDATVNGSTLTLTFDQTLDSDSNPGASPFTVTVAGSDRSVAAVGISGSTVTLTLGTAVTSGQTVTVSYARPEERPLQHEGAQGPSFSDESVTNNTP